MHKIANQRSNIYGFLSKIYSSEVTESLLQGIRVSDFFTLLSDLGANLQEDFLNTEDEMLLKDLSIEYKRLFAGPAIHIPPYESMHHGMQDCNWESFWADWTLHVREFAKYSGLDYIADITDMPDHISDEFEFMHKTVLREALAWQQKDNDCVLRCLHMEREMIKEHLYKWIPGFCREVTEMAEHSFYREMAKLTEHFMAFEYAGIDDNINFAESLKNEAFIDQ
ncbi:MAG: molecular chaperone TorD family protein [Nitrospira sp.]|nr:molecular chaperone TorD family protein [Nitrospira sp.]